MDQLTKFAAVSHLTAGNSLPVIKGFFHLTLVHNTGIAFGLFQDKAGLLLCLISVSLIVLLYLGMRLSSSDRMARISFALILGGALGNWIDRVRVRAVIDFLDFRVWPVFNIADSAITVGVGLYLISIFARDKINKEETL